MTSLTDTAPRPSSATAARSPWRAAVVAFLFTVAAALVLAAAFVFGLASLHAGKAPPGVTVAGVSIAGLDRAEAEARLRQELPSMSAGALHLVSPEGTIRVPYADIGRDYEFAQALDHAFSVGRDGSVADQTIGSVRSLIEGTAIGLEVGFDESRLKAAIGRAVAGADRDPVDATIRLRPDGRSFSTTPSADGVAVDRVHAALAATRAMVQAGHGDATVALHASRVAPAFPTQRAEDAVAEAMRQAETIGGDGLVLSHADTRFRIPASELRRWLTFTTTNGREWAPALVSARVEAAVKGITAKVDRQPRDAAFRFGQGNSVRVVPGQDGRRVDVRATAAAIRQALMARTTGSPNPQLALVVRPTEPSYTTEMAKAGAKKVKRLSTWTTHYVPSEKNFWGNNISRPAQKIDGHTVAPGEWFDFWEVVGSLRKLGGVGPGGFINNGRTDPTGAFGGGICSCSTTIFNAAMRAGLEAGARKAHYYYISRYPLGLDATVARSESFVTTMSFRNDTPHPILIRAINSEGAVRFDIYGVPNRRQVVFSEPRVWNREEAGDSIEYTDELPPGARKRVEWPVDGMDVSVTRHVRDAKGKLLHKDTWVSDYGTVTGVVQVGVPKGSPLDGKFVPVP